MEHKIDLKERDKNKNYECIISPKNSEDNYNL